MKAKKSNGETKFANFVLIVRGLRPTEENMNWCNDHWNQLRAAIELRGLSGFGAQTGQQVVEDIKKSIEEGKDAQFDPLSGSWSQINTRMLKDVGLRAFGQCPLCILVEDGQLEMVQNWIDGVTDSALKYARDHGLVKVI